MLNRIFVGTAAIGLICSPAIAGELPVIGEGDWRTHDSAAVPWSEPVMVSDEFDGDYLAVIDRNYVFRNAAWDNSKIGVISNWSENQIRIYGFEQSACRMFCRNSIRPLGEADSLAVKVGDQVFRIDGVDGNFPVSPELAEALANAPEGNAKIKISFEGSGASHKNDIGAGTVESWRVVYGEQG